ncbi:hypothetical protein JMF97_09965 [Micromonospora fiedleri]|uniref:Uncharacterized protein n=1 Tax=Micromonospora fiedleri TaxID=1157498 RepID=A0ABS1UJG0_9ACTN|nr:MULTISPECIES: hypothetical protein [Micromonospora]MBL6276487.1 hypothetical protein [Micromonospora fiedleri]WSK40341.1 hypothetical protein OG712_17545 [Micromonospora maris]
MGDRSSMSGSVGAGVARSSAARDRSGGSARDGRANTGTAGHRDDNNPGSELAERSTDAIHKGFRATGESGLDSVHER